MIEEAELSGYLDGELSPDRLKHVESALATDPELVRKLQQLRCTDDLLLASAQNIADSNYAQSKGTHRVLQPAVAVTALAAILVALKLTTLSIDPLLATLIEASLLGGVLVFTIIQWTALEWES